MFEIDDNQYQSGRDAFTGGARLRDVVTVAAGLDDDDKMASLLLGFADALLDQLRKPLVIADAGTLVR